MSCIIAYILQHKITCKRFFLCGLSHKDLGLFLPVNQINLVIEAMEIKPNLFVNILYKSKKIILFQVNI